MHEDMHGAHPPVSSLTSSASLDGDALSRVQEARYNPRVSRHCLANESAPLISSAPKTNAPQTTKSPACARERLGGR
jgi:hypothetical protein